MAAAIFAEDALRFPAAGHKRRTAHMTGSRLGPGKISLDRLVAFLSGSHLLAVLVLLISVPLTWGPPGAPLIWTAWFNYTMGVLSILGFVCIGAEVKVWSGRPDVSYRGPLRRFGVPGASTVLLVCYWSFLLYSGGPPWA